MNKKRLLGVMFSLFLLALPVLADEQSIYYITRCGQIVLTISAEDYPGDVEEYFDYLWDLDEALCP